MYNGKDMKMIKNLINKEVREQHFQLGMAETELMFSINNIKEKGEGHKPFETSLTLGEFKEMTEAKISRIKKELEELSLLHFKTNMLLNKIDDQNNEEGFKKANIFEKNN